MNAHDGCVNVVGKIREVKFLGSSDVNTRVVGIRLIYFIVL